MKEKYTISKEQIDQTIENIKTGQSTYDQEMRKYGMSARSTLLIHTKKYYPDFSYKYLCHFHKTNHNFFDNLGQNQYYCLGLIAADGHVSSQKFGDKYNRVIIGLHQKDSELLERLNLIMGNKKPIKYSFPLNNSPMAVLSANSVKIVDFLTSLDIVPRKSLIYKIHKSLFENHDLFFHFLRGIFDGDGCIYRCDSHYIKKDKTCQKKFVFSISGSQISCQQISTFLYKNYKLGNGKIRKSGPNCYEFRLQGNQQLKKLYLLLYKDAEVFLERKHNKFLELINS